MRTGTIRKNNARTSRSGALWLALVAGAAMPVVALTAPVALSQEAAVAVDIPAGPLSLALNRLAAGTGLQIGFDSAAVRGMSTPGLKGNFTPRAALDRLLAGSGLRPAFTDSRTVTLAATGGTDSAIGNAGDTVLDTIVVHGEKMSRDAFSTYSSAGVVTSKDIADHNITSFGQSLDRLANARTMSTGDGNNKFVIRGLNAEGVTQPSRAAPIISYVVDGAAQGVEAMRRGSRSDWDVEQVEVLRGPQSTLQGRNALGGAVIVKTKDPTWTPEVIVDGMLGSDKLKSTAFAVSTPVIADQLAVRVAGQFSRQTKDIAYADPAIASLGEDKFQDIRAKVLLTPEALPGFTGLFTISRTHDKPAWSLVSGPDFFARRYVDTSGTAAEFRDTHVNRYVADLGYEITPDWKLSSVTALSGTDMTISTPAGASLIRDDTRDGFDFTQDVRLTYEPQDGAFSGVFGLFAGRFDNDLNSSIDTTMLAPYGIPLASVQVLDARNSTTSFAVYGDMRYHFAERWTLLGGGRLLRDKVSANYRGVALDVPATLGSGSLVYGSLDENNAVANTEFLPKVGLAFDLTDTQSLAFTLSKGYRSGYSEAVAGSAVVNRIDPEYLWSYELAYRSKWLDDTLQFNANAFYYDYKNQQILTYNAMFPGQTITENSGKSHAYGAEFELRYRPVDELELFSSVGLLRTEFEEGITTAGDLKGKEFPESPTITASAGAIWRHESGFFAGADISYTDGYYSAGDLANSPGLFVDSFTLVNAQIGIKHEKATITLFARNLFDKQYLTSISSTGTEAAIGEGRVLGLRANVTF